MAYDEYLGERIKRILDLKKVDYYAKKMMGGLIFMVNNKMFCGIHIHKTLNYSLLMVRIGEEEYLKHLNKDVCLPMDFTGRPMRGYIFVIPAGFDKETDLEYWINLCLQFNPLAKMSKKRKSKK